MPNYSFKATDMNGGKINSVINSVNEASAVNQLSGRGYVVLELKEIKEKTRRSIFALKLLDLMTFSRQLAIMVDSGVNLANALEVLSEQEVFTPKFRNIIKNVVVNIESGMSFAEALKSERQFDDIFVNLVEAGENSGTLAETLEKVAQFYESQKKINDEVKSGMAYPVFILGFSVVIVLVITLFILPQLISSFGTEPTGFIKILMDANYFIKENWLLVTIVTISLIIGIVMFFKTNSGKTLSSKILSVIPGIKQVRKNSSIERFCRTLSVMVSAGIDIIKALQLASKASNDIRFEKVTNQMAEMIKKGIGLESAFDQTGAFPGIVVAMVGTGERTGKLDSILERVADFFEDKVRTSVKQMISLIQPVMIVLVGMFIAFIAYTMYTAIFQGQMTLTGGL